MSTYTCTPLYAYTMPMKSCHERARLTQMGHQPATRFVIIRKALLNFNNKKAWWLCSVKSRSWKSENRSRYYTMETILKEYCFRPQNETGKQESATPLKEIFVIYYLHCTDTRKTDLTYRSINLWPWSLFTCKPLTRLQAAAVGARSELRTEKAFLIGTYESVGHQVKQSNI